MLQSIVQEPSSVAKWLDLFNWGGAILKPPKRGGQRHNRSATIGKRISTSPARLTSEAPAFIVNDKSRNSPTISQAVAAKLSNLPVVMVFLIWCHSRYFAS